MTLWCNRASSNVKFDIAKESLAKAVFTHIMLLVTPKFLNVIPDTAWQEIVVFNSAAIFTIFKVNATGLKIPTSE